MGTKRKTYQDSFSLDIKREPTKIQKQVGNFLKSNQLSILTGDPGTAKTFLSIYYGLNLLKDGAITEIILSKPIQEVGKSMGFLPGSEEDKISAYMDSYTATFDKLLGVGGYGYLVKSKRVRFEPVNFVRGTTFENALVILDEAQGLTLHELITFATRLSDSAKMIILGDVYQADIRNSGLPQFKKIVSDIQGIGQMELGDEFQMRSGLVLQMYRNYKKHLHETGILL
jgi:phosphate starvation-inducible PhoH-like protein